MHHNRRRHERHACFLKAEVHIAGHKDALSAEAIDISDGGFRLIFSSEIEVPNRFMLVIPRRKIKEYVKVARRQRGEIGVLIENMATDPTPETARQVSGRGMPVAISAKPDRETTQQQQTTKLTRYKRWVDRIWS